MIIAMNVDSYRGFQDFESFLILERKNLPTGISSEGHNLVLYNFFYFRYIIIIFMIGGVMVIYFSIQWICAIYDQLPVLLQEMQRSGKL